MFATDIVVLLAVASASLLVGRALRLPAIVAYLVAGVVVGAGGLGWVPRSAAIAQIAELGVALLLFGVGIEFSLEGLRQRLLPMFVSAGLQVGLTIAVAAAVLHVLGIGWAAAVFLGFLVSLSSTAIVFKLYTDRGEIDAPHAHASAGILLFQDLALVPMMFLVPVLASPGEHVAMAAARALVQAVVAVAVVLLLARIVLPRLLGLVARAHTPELFPLVALVIAFGAAIGASALGLSLPIGTFLAGLALSGSPYAHQVFAELLPLRDAFVAVFFTSIGMLLVPAEVVAAPALFGGMVGLVAVKAVLVAVIVGIVWRSATLAILAGGALAQVGEFSFVLSRAGVGAGLLPAADEQAFLGAAILTMAATPACIRLTHRLAASLRLTPPAPVEPALRDHVLVLGYGATGQAVARVLRETGIQFVAVDLMASAVEAAQVEGMPVRFGDVSRRAVLEALGAERARAAVVTVGEPATTRRVVSLLRQMNPDIRILVRAQRVAEIEEIERLGADDVVPSEFETSIELFVRLLQHLGVPRHVVRVQESLIRLDHYQALRGVGASAELLASAGRIIAGGILETAQVMAGSGGAGRTLAELDLRRRTGATVLSIVRRDTPLPPPDGSTRLEVGDLVVLYGPHETIDAALAVLEPRAGARTGEVGKP